MHVHCVPFIFFFECHKKVQSFFEFQLSNLYQPYKNLRVKSSEADQEQVSLLEKKLFGAQEELTELHRRRGENAQQIIDQSNQSKEHENRIKQLQDLLEASGMSLS